VTSRGQENPNYERFQDQIELSARVVESESQSESEGILSGVGVGKNEPTPTPTSI
jgi:hypothetical protein